MNMTDFATWTQMVSSAAVLVTLVYLSIQTRQTATLLKSESRQWLIDLDLQLLSNQIQIPELTINWGTEDEPTMEQKYQLWAYLHAFMRTREHQWLQYRNGVLDKATWLTYQSAIPAVIGSKRCRDWWKTFSSPLYEREFAESVDALLDGSPDSDLHQKILAWK